MTDRSSHGLSRRDLLKLTAAMGGAASLPSVAASIMHPLGGQSRSPGGGGTAIAGRKAISDELPKKVPPSRAKRPNVLLILLDTVRADHLSCYGYERKTTPNLDAFAATARKYTNVMSPGSYTLPSHASLFTGLPESAHGVKFTHQYLDRQSATLAELLAKAGYQTAAWSCNMFYVAPRCGFDRGFQQFGVCFRAADMHRELARWFTSQYQPEKPFFIFLNYIEAHYPYAFLAERVPWISEDVAADWVEKKQRALFVPVFKHLLTGLDMINPDELALIKSMYDGAITYLDQKLSQLFSFLERNGLKEDTLIIVTSDHGEHFNEHHLMWHGFSLYEPLLQVPLIARYPDRFEPGENHDLVQSHDVFPTVLDVAQVEWKKQAAHHCESLLRTQVRPRLGVAEQLAPLMDYAKETADEYPQIDLSRLLCPLRAVRKDNMKLIRSCTGTRELYDLDKDPLELQNLATKHPGVAQDLSRKLDEWLESFEHYRYVAEAHTDVRTRTTVEEFREGRGLGYVH